MPHFQSHFRKPTVEIVAEDHPDGFIVISASEFDEKAHKLYEPDASEEVEAAEESSDGEPSAPENPDPKNPDKPLEDLRNADIRDLAAENFGVQLSTGLNKQELIAAFRDLESSG